MNMDLKILRAAMTSVSIAAIVSSLPLELQFVSADGLVRITPSFAFAKDEGRDDDDRGGDDRGGGRHDRGNGDPEDDRGRSHGGSDGRPDNSNRENNQGSGRGRGGRDDHGGRHDGNGRGNIEATFSDGSRVEIENGRFERKDANGRTVEERQATAADLERLRVGNGRSGQERSGGGIVAKAEVEGGNIEVTYTDGWKEEIEGGRYELKDALNRTVVERPAKASDRQRLSAVLR